MGLCRPTAQAVRDVERLDTQVGMATRRGVIRLLLDKELQAYYINCKFRKRMKF
jgi:hypothetical protein